MCNLQCFSKLNEKPCFWFGCSRNGECILNPDREPKNSYLKNKTSSSSNISDKDYWSRNYSKGVVRLIKAGHDAACVCCYSLENLTFDHITPRSRGGSNDVLNGQILCETCNGVKSHKLLSLEELRSLVAIEDNCFYYKGIVDKRPVKVTIIQHDEKRERVEIIRNENINNRTNYAGFWVNSSEIITKYQKEMGLYL